MWTWFALSFLGSVFGSEPLVACAVALLQTLQCTDAQTISRVVLHAQALGKLDLNPKFNAPYVLPVLLSGVEGSIASSKKGSYTLTVAFGKLILPAGGLSVDGVSYSKAINMTGGDSISWKNACVV